MRCFFVILVVLLACSSTPPEEVLMVGIYDYAELAHDTLGNSTTVYFDDGRAITVTWPDETYCLFMQKGDSIMAVRVGTGTGRKTEIRIIGQ